MSILQITPEIAIDEAELAERFIHASGPGGQNVNKVASAVQLRFNVVHSPALTSDVRRRLIALAGRRMTVDGELVLVAREHRTQERNRAEARERLFDLIRRAAIPPIRRRKTRPTLASKKRRLESKTARATVKKARAKPGVE